MNCVRMWSGSDHSLASIGGPHQTFKIIHTQSGELRGHFQLRPFIAITVFGGPGPSLAPQPSIWIKICSLIHCLHDNCWQNIINVGTHQSFPPTQQVRVPCQFHTATCITFMTFSFSQFIPIWIYTFDKHIQHEINVFHLDQIIIWINGASFSLILPHNERNDKPAGLYTFCAGRSEDGGWREV